MNDNNDMETLRVNDTQIIAGRTLKHYVAPRLTIINELQVESGGQSMDESLGDANLS